MTATRIVRRATLAVAAASWVIAAWFLWRTTVPSPLRLPHLDEQSVFGAHLVRDARSFERFLDWEWVIATAVALCVYGLMARRGPALASRLGLGATNAGIVVGIVTFTAAWAVGVPFALLANWWERRHGISHEGYGAVLAAEYGQLIGRTLVALLAVAIVLGLARRVGRGWWLPSGAILAALLLALQFVQPYQASIGTHAIRSARLAGWVHELEQREHAGRPTVRIADVSGRTKAANAFAIGLGPTERVIVWNTLLGGRFASGQIRFVIGHELGHLVRNHIARGIGWFALLALPVLLVVSRLADIREPGSVPIAILVLIVASLLLLPVRNAISRRYEAEADWIGLNGTRDPAAARGLFRGFVATSLLDPSPPGWVHVLLDDHPTPLQRVEMARAWKLRLGHH